ncbi:TetR/AcrR family transcriptional regulator [Allobacillus sp. GCM10007491]|uniref:TetR family transcriptional regulator n=1 Tax=Allobacillus saliphilus TaxID=2912308 RepID=A0A941CWV5_9BACI|nr:TetR/AcrR family transcriptional regulator [Allobacillus saliphilus]MBR7553878.1 TetR family transcriptional regulator [Allobacillus saliphilus]MBR7554822.1 TetR family transcriptional regulator [Allobacillus saliphilus]
MSLREKKVAKRKKDLIMSAIAIIGEKGYHSTTMEEIASKLLMTKGSIYYYFKDKQDLVYQSQKILLEQSNENIEEVLSEDLPYDEKLKKVMVVHIEYLITEQSGFVMGTNPEQFFSGKQLETILMLRDRYGNYIKQLIAEGVKEGFFTEVDEKIVRNIILGAMNWVVTWYSPNGPMDKTTLAKSISNYLLKIVLK